MEINPQGTPMPIVETPVEPVEIQGTQIEPQVLPIPVVPQTDGNEDEIKGLSQEEYNDPNQIQISIRDDKSPIVVLFGPPACGKTMTLVRLTRYLKHKGFKVVPIETFRPSADSHYKAMCSNFNSDVNSRKAADSTKNISFMLVKVIDGNGRTICQILEAPGEYYYNPKKPTEDFPSYVNVIRASKNRKIWCYMVEHEWKDQQDRDGYVDKIRLLKRSMRHSDKAVFIFNKIDKTDFINYGHINEKEARKEIKDFYPGLLEMFQSKGIFGKSDDFKFVPFQTGFYSEDPAGGLFFDAGDDIYPRNLWETIRKLVRG